MRAMHVVHGRKSLYCVLDYTEELLHYDSMILFMTYNINTAQSNSIYHYIIYKLYVYYYLFLCDTCST